MKSRLIQRIKTIKHSSYLRKLNRDKCKLAKSIRSSHTFSSNYKQLENSIEIPTTAKYSGIWAVAMVRNEEDIIELSIRHLISQGIDRILIVDNLSTDNTRAILEKLSKSLPITLGIDHEKAYYQSEKMTFLCDFAFAHGANWVIPFDADEFWYAQKGTLKDFIYSQKSSILEARLYNQFPTKDGKWVIDSLPHPDGKISFKKRKNFVVSMGNHEVITAGTKDSGLYIIHRPWRSKSQLINKLRQGYEALALTDIDETKGYHWRANGSASEDELYLIWQNLLEGKASDDLAWRPKGKLSPMDSILPATWDIINME